MREAERRVRWIHDEKAIERRKEKKRNRVRAREKSETENVERNGVKERDRMRV